MVAKRRAEAYDGRFPQLLRVSLLDVVPARAHAARVRERVTIDALQDLKNKIVGEQVEEARARRRHLQCGCTCEHHDG